MAPTEILAEQHAETAAALPRGHAVPRRPADRLDAGGRAAGAAGRARGRAASTLVVGTHALIEEDVALRAARSGDRGRAAPVRRRPARAAAREGAPARHPGDDGDADSAHAAAHALRRARRVGDPRHAARAGAGEDDREARGAARRGPRVRRASRWSRGGRRASSTRSWRSRRRSTCAPRPTMADHLAHDVFPAYRVGLLHGRMAPAAKDDVMRRVRGRRDPHPRRDDRRRGRDRRAERDGHGGRARGALRPVAAPPAARAGRARARTSRTACCSTRSRCSDEAAARLAGGGGDDRRVRDRREGPRAARRRATWPARGRPGCRRCASATWLATGT